MKNPKILFKKINKEYPKIIEDDIVYIKPDGLYDKGTITVDVSECIKKSSEKNIDFDLYFSDLISHEWIHHILLSSKMYSENYCFDEMYHKKGYEKTMGSGI